MFCRGFQQDWDKHGFKLFKFLCVTPPHLPSPPAHTSKSSLSEKRNSPSYVINYWSCIDKYSSWFSRCQANIFVFQCHQLNGKDFCSSQIRCAVQGCCWKWSKDLHHKTFAPSLTFPVLHCVSYFLPYHFFLQLYPETLFHPVLSLVTIYHC